MIAPSVVQEVRRLLAEGSLSQRKIAKIAGISRGTVGAIASGRRPDYVSRRPTERDEFPEPAGPPQRCSGCGGMVYMPCRLCHARALKAGRSKPPIPQWLMQLDEPLGLDLKAADRARYEEVRAERIRAESESEPDDPGEAANVDGDDERGLDPAVLRDAFETDEAEPAIDDVAEEDYDDEWCGDLISAWSR